MRTIYEVKLNDSGINGLAVRNEELVKSSGGVHNPHAYNLGLLAQLSYLVKAVFNETDNDATRLLDRIDGKIAEETKGYIETKDL